MTIFRINIDPPKFVREMEIIDFDTAIQAITELNDIGIDRNKAIELFNKTKLGHPIYANFGFSYIIKGE